MISALALFLVSALPLSALALSSSAPPAGARMAIVASATSADGQAVLRYADRDAERMAAVLRELGGWGFVGVELDGDWGRRTPAVLAPQALLDLKRAGLPLRIGVAVPWAPVARSGDPGIGVVFRAIVEVD